jgi:hypothetical protein
MGFDGCEGGRDAFRDRNGPVRAGSPSYGILQSIRSTACTGAFAPDISGAMAA